MKLSKTEIAERLHISKNALMRITEASGLKHEDIMVDGKLTRHFEWEEVLEAIKKGKY